MAITIADIAAELVVRRLSGELPKPKSIDTSTTKRSDAIRCHDRPLRAYKLLRTVDHINYR